jgi:glycine cleavage system T protein
MLETASALKRTPFHPRHVALGAKMVPFAGHEMPIQYEGIMAEHRTVRTGVGVFDVSHMGEIRLTGRGAIAFANRLVTNEAGELPVGKVVYTPMCLESGGIIDDLLVYGLGEDRLLVVNAANFEKDLAWVLAHATPDVTVHAENAETAQLAVQGPKAEDVVARLYGERVRALGFYEGFETGADEDWTLISRTGYTGEDGFEIYVRAPGRWISGTACLRRSLARNRPIGLGRGTRPPDGYCLTERHRRDYESARSWARLDGAPRQERLLWNRRDTQKGTGVKRRCWGWCSTASGSRAKGARLRSWTSPRVS